MDTKQLLFRADEISEQLKNLDGFSNDIPHIFEYLASIIETQKFALKSIDDWYLISFIISKLNSLDINDLCILHKRSTSDYIGLVKINESFKCSLVNKVVKINYNNLYPSILHGYINNDKFKEDILLCYLIDFKSVYNFVYESYMMIRTECKKNNGVKPSYVNLMKLWINYTYGIVTTTSLIADDDIKNEINNVLNSIYAKFKDNIIYFNIDSIYFYRFNDIQELFKLFNKELNKKYKYLSYWEEDLDYFCLIGKRNYIEIPIANSIISKGFKVK